jgi:hypothetical protein
MVKGPRIHLSIIGGEWYATARNNSKTTRSAMIPAINWCDKQNEKEGRGRTAKQRRAARIWALGKKEGE